jgi:hypothetical protein
MPRLHRLPRKTAVALVLVAVLFNVQLGAHHQAKASAANRPIAARTLSATTPAAATSPVGGPCSVPGIGDIGGLLGFCSLGSSGLTGDLNNLCQPGVPQPEPATSGVDALIKPPLPPGKVLATPYNQYGMSGQFWAATNLQCSDMTSLIGNDVAGMLFDFAKAMDRVTITVYQSAAGGGILGWLQGVANHLISGLGNAIYFPYVAVVIIIAAIWLAWQGLIRKRGTRTIEGTIWMVVACAAAIWLIGRPADFTGLGKGISDGISATLNTAFAHLPSPGQASCLPVAKTDPQINPASFSYTSGRTVVDQNANELWTVLVCKPWLDGEFGMTTYATATGAKPTPVNTFGRQLLWAQAIAASERSTTSLVQAKQAAYSGIASTMQQKDPTIYPLFQGKQWTTRLEIAFASLLAAVVAGVLVLLISVTLILLKLGFLLLLIVGPFFLLVGTHPGFGRVVAVRWFEMLVGVLLKQAAVALALSLLLYCYALIMGTTDAVLPWALKILMITLVTAAVFIYRKPFQHLFAAVGYGAIGSSDRAEADLSRAAATARTNTRDAATIAVPGFAAYRAARWARRNPAQAAGLALGAATAVSASSVAAGLAATGADGSAPSGADAHEYAGGGVSSGGGGTPDPAGVNGASSAASRARAWGASAGNASASEAPPLRLPSAGSAPPRWPQNGSAATGQAAGNGHAAAAAHPARSASSPPPGTSAGASSAGAPVTRRPDSAPVPRSWTTGGSPPSAPRPLPISSAPRQAAESARQAPPPRQAPPLRQVPPARQPRSAGQARRARPASGRPFGGSTGGSGSGAGGGAGRRGEPPALPLSGPASRPQGGQQGAAGGEQAGPFWLRPIWRRKS